jgi:hypothetical protein
MLQLLRRRGAALDIKEDPCFGTALRQSVDRGLESMVEILLEEGAEAESKLVGIAIRRGYHRIATILREYLGKLSPGSQKGNKSIVLFSW